MKTSIKGGGKLSRKLLTILMMVGMLSSGSLLAADNSIYIDQSGDFANVTINQDGAGNQVRGLQANGGDDKTIASVIRGNGVNVNINQVGGTNKLDLGINAIMAGNKSVDFTYSTVNAGNLTGNNNTGIFQLGNSSATLANSIVSVVQVNGNNYAEVRMQGSDNTLNALQSGGNASLTSLVNASGTNQQITTAGGTGNSISTTLTGQNGQVYVNVMGASNTVAIAQDGTGGSTGHQATMDINGTGNTVNLAQAGSPAANVFNLRVGSAGSAASTNTYNITQTTR
jgi:hypothetical protein